MHEDHLSTTWALVGTVANLGIVFGYVLVPFTVLRYLPLTRNVMVAGTLFFLTCALTHMSMAFGFEHTRAMVVNHAVQSVAVVWFVLGFFRLLRTAVLMRGNCVDAKPIDPDVLT